MSVVIVVLAGAIWVRVTSETWPTLSDPAAFVDVIDEAVAGYEADPRPFDENLMPYRSDGDYLGWSIRTWPERPNRHFDEDGIPMILYGSEFQYNPVTVAQYALSLHGKGEVGTFLHVAAYLRDELLEDDGSLRFGFRYKHYLGVLEPGWTSAMAQGHALSVFARAYRLDADSRWLEAGRAALEFVVSDASGLSPTLSALDGSLARRRFLAEYPLPTADYTLNGAMFAMLGLYDWADLDIDEPSVDDAQRSFDSNLETLVSLLPYYDMGRISAYDLSYLTYGGEPHIIPRYHSIHIYQLHALASVTDDSTLRTWERQWTSYVDGLIGAGQP